MNRELGILGWSQAELARKLGVTPAAVTSWRKRGAPRAVLRYLEAMVKLHEVVTMGQRFIARTPRRRRGVSTRVWEPSATDHAPAVPGEDYVRKLEGWEASDMDQDDGGYNRG